MARCCGCLPARASGSSAATATAPLARSPSLMGLRCAAAGSISFDGSNAINLSARAIIEAAQLDLASVVVNLGDVPAGTTGTTFTAEMLERFGAASDLLIRGHQLINLYGTFELGRRDASGVATLQALTLDTGLLQGGGASARQPKITAQALSLRNSGATATYTGPDTVASLNLDVDRLLLGPGNVSLGGFLALQGQRWRIANVRYGRVQRRQRQHRRSRLRFSRCGPGDRCGGGRITQSRPVAICSSTRARLPVIRRMLRSAAG